MRLDRLWTGLAGAVKYAMAIASGDVAPAAMSDARLGSCRGCDAVTIAVGTWSRHVMAFCGEPLVDHTGESIALVDRTCGCLVGHVPTGGQAVERADSARRQSIALPQLVPAGKTRVASEACPRGRWGPCPRCVAATGASGATADGLVGPDGGRESRAANAP